MTPDVLVVGAGSAGLAAATALAEGGAVVEVLEARASAGGRARSWTDPATGDVEDNGQHLLLGCYDELFRFLRRTGGSDGVALQERLEVILLEPGGRVSRFRPSRLPAPFDLLGGLVRLRGFPFADALRARRIATALRRRPDAGAARTVDAWLGEVGQSARARRGFWDPLTLATLNLDPAGADAELLVAVLRRALLAGPEASRIGFAKAGLSPVLVDPAVRYLRERGGEVRGGSLVTALDTDEKGRFRAARLRDGTARAAAGAILAVPPRQAAELLRGKVEDGFDAAAAARLGGSSIVAVHLWFDRVVSEHAFAGLLDSPIHWVFDRTRVGTARPPGYLALVTSAANGLLTRDRDDLVRLAVAELRRFCPRARGATLRRSRVLKERWATPDLGPGSETLRPEPATSLPNLFLAGDWTRTGLPATLEGAAASGHRAASLLAGA